MSLTISHRLDNGNNGTIRLRLWVSAYTDPSDPHVFAHQRMAFLVDDPGPLDRFSHVCSLADIEQYPVDQPTSGIRPFFRKTHCDITFESSNELERVWEQIKKDVEMLERNIKETEIETSNMEISA